MGSHSFRSQKYDQNQINRKYVYEIKCIDPMPVINFCNMSAETKSEVEWKKVDEVQKLCVPDYQFPFTFKFYFVMCVISFWVFCKQFSMRSETVCPAPFKKQNKREHTLRQRWLVGWFVHKTNINYLDGNKEYVSHLSALCLSRIINSLLE